MSISIFCLCFLFSSDGTRIIVAVGTRVLYYDAQTGNLIESLRGLSLAVTVRSYTIVMYLFFLLSGHKETVLSVGYSYDSTRFASGMCYLM